jgi:Na+/proline symporter
LAVALVCDCVVTLFLATLGFALLAYFRANPHLLPDAQTIGSNADKLFPQYIAIGLPAGMSGLAVAGLLAAGMSALSSGINSSTTVVAVDFLDRFAPRAAKANRDARRARLVSIAIGLLIVLISVVIRNVSGNLLELVSKVANLFVAPLFLLFFMAMFVPRATSFGTFVGALAAIAAAIAIAFFNLFGLSFLWIMPCSFVTGVVVASVVSLVPTGRRAGRRLPIGEIIGETDLPLETPAVERL